MANQDGPAVSLPATRLLPRIKSLNGHFGAISGSAHVPAGKTRPRKILRETAKRLALAKSLSTLQHIPTLVADLATIVPSRHEQKPALCLSLAVHAGATGVHIFLEPSATSGAPRAPKHPTKRDSSDAPKNLEASFGKFLIDACPQSLILAAAVELGGQFLPFAAPYRRAAACKPTAQYPDPARSDESPITLSSLPSPFGTGLRAADLARTSQRRQYSHPWCERQQADGLSKKEGS